MDSFYLAAFFAAVLLPFGCLAITEEALVTDIVYLDISIDGSFVGAIQIGLFGATTPKTVQNFLSLATHEVLSVQTSKVFTILYCIFTPCIAIVWIWIQGINFPPTHSQFHDAR